jgi:DNA gyrase inhibitor GyrI
LQERDEYIIFHLASFPLMLNHKSSENASRFADYFRRESEAVGFSELDFGRNNEEASHDSANPSDGGMCIRRPVSNPGQLIRPESGEWKATTPVPSVRPKVKIIEMPDMDVASVRFIGPYTKISRAVTILYAWAQPLGLLANYPLVFCALYDVPGITPIEDMRSDACILVPHDTQLKAPVSKRHIASGGTYACAHFEFRDKREFPVHWYEMCNRWLPRSGYRMDDRPMLEIYRGDPRMLDGFFRVDICIPIEQV